MAKKVENIKIQISPILKTVEVMSIVSGLGENKLRSLIEQGEVDYVQNGNRKLLTESAIWDWYERTKIRARDRSLQNQQPLEFMREAAESE